MRTYGSNNSTAEDITLCIQTVYDDWFKHQCPRKRGHGTDGLYCKQHDPERIAARAKKRQAKWDKESAKRMDVYSRQAALVKLAEDIPTDQLDKYKLELI